MQALDADLMTDSEDEDLDTAGFEEDDDDGIEPELTRADKRSVAERQRAHAWIDRRSQLAAADPASAPDDLYADYLRQIRQCAHTNSINEFLFDLNTHCPKYESEGPGKLAVLARLIAEHILTPVDGSTFTFAIDRSHLPADSRDPYQTVITYLAHHCLRTTVDHHDLLYRAEVYAQVDRTAVLERLTAEGYLDKRGHILKRPNGSSVETYHYETKRGHAAVLIHRHADGWTASMSCSITTKDSEGFGMGSPVLPPEHDWNAPEPLEVFADRATASRAAFCAVAEQAEKTAVEAALSPDWNPGAAREARALRAWAEFSSGSPIPEQLPPTYRESRRLFLASVLKLRATTEPDQPETIQFQLF